MERVLAEWVKAKVPQIISGADGNIAQGLLQVMPFTQVRDMLLAMAENSGNDLEQTDPQWAITHGPAGDQSMEGL